ncbi:helix-turn-helix domain-containing protein [Streptomyces sp. TRM43335]|uniref:Helix-turn-helix domain-containing protein n=2 Tax=Streptomyces taklimakanensis TaxID=2569853 RepID=A0A6G2BJM4_9ACTN|nr:AraC family transcriptional regulator [Streptomyces taklimakanensis]MTE22316.1 helix-turn-helix domain-containing protein [Streptomyces taklimakanensis]
MFADTGASGVARHRHPAWKVVLSIGGRVEVDRYGGRPVVAPGVVVPPQLAHTCRATSAFVALFVDPWLLCPGPGVTRLDEPAVRRILAALGGVDAHGPRERPDFTEARAELTAVAGAGHVPDPRVLHALRRSVAPGSLDAVAADVGLSAPRLRALVRASVGIPLVRLRQWARLRTAVACLPDGSAAAAAAAGFADQPHLIRVARDLTGRTPASLRRPPPR